MYSVHPEVKKIQNPMWEAWEKSPEKQLPMGKLNIEEKKENRKLKEMTEIQKHFMFCCRILYIGLIRPSNKPSHVVPKCTLFNLDFCAYCVNYTRATTFL
jgi:hypothetical protein